MNCKFPGCGEVAIAHGLCEGHRKQLQRGSPLAPLRHRAAPATLADADLLVRAAAIAYADSPRELAGAAYVELLRAFEARRALLGQQVDVPGRLRD